MGCGPSRATEASAYGVDAAGRVPDAPSAGRQTPACSRGEDACPQPEEPHPEGTQSDAPSAKRHRSVRAPRDDDEESSSGVDGRCPPDVSSTSTLRRLSSLAATHPLASAASPSAPRRPNLARWTERHEDDPTFTDLAERSFQRSFEASVATSSFASRAHTARTETEKTDVSESSEDEDDEDDEDEDEQTAYREVLAAAAAAVREAVDAVRVAAAPAFFVRLDEVKKKPSFHRRAGPLERSSASTNARHDENEDENENDTNTHRENDDVRVPSRVPSVDPRRVPVGDDDGKDAKEKTKIDFLGETLARDESGYRFVPGVGVTTSRRAPAAAVAKTAMDLARRAGRLEERGRAIRF